MNEPNDNAPPHSPPGKSELVRDAIVFQFKLLVDGIRDFVLIPVSFGAAIISLLKPGAGAGPEFYKVVAFGRTTERKINLFSSADKIVDGADVEAVAEELPDLDTLIGEFEAFAKKEYSGERFAPARERLKRLRQSVKDTKSAQEKPADDAAKEDSD